MSLPEYLAFGDMVGAEFTGEPHETCMAEVRYYRGDIYEKLKAKVQRLAQMITALELAVTEGDADNVRLKSALLSTRHVMEMAVLKYRGSLGLHVSYQQALLELDRFADSAAKPREADQKETPNAEN